MGNDAQWVEDVRRWYYGGAAPATDALASPDGGDAHVNNDPVIGYEAAQPALQARHWPELPAGDVQL